MRAILCLGMFGLASGLVGPVTRLDDAGCGGCVEESTLTYTNDDGQVIESDYKFRRCNTGNDPDKIPFDTNQPNAISAKWLDAPGNAGFKDQFEKHGLSTAQAMTLTDIRALVNTEPFTWDRMFCSSSLDRYRDGATLEAPVAAGNGAACVRDNSRKAVLDADAEARNMFYFLGTRNGYPYSQSLNKGSAASDEAKKWGTDFTGDVPEKWCDSYMKHMLCGIAFPQVALSEASVQAAEAVTASIGNLGAAVDVKNVFAATGNLRPINHEGCEDMHAACVRHEPDEDTEAVDEYIHPNMTGVRAIFFERNQVGETEGAMDASLLCNMWARGHGLSLAGVSLANGDDSKLVDFSAAGAVQVSFAALMAAVLAFAL